MQVEERTITLRIDIVSDIVCPWCVIGYRQLREALAGLADEFAARVHWHPFELNRAMPAQGQNLREHLAQKYGTTPEQSLAARARLTKIGADLGFHFRYDDEMRVVNTFRAHQLMDWAADHGRQNELAMELFARFFSRREDVSQPPVLTAAARAAGLPEDEAYELLKTGARADRVREEQARWLDRGVYAVPTFFIDGSYPITGAQSVDKLQKMLRKATEVSQ